MRLDHVRGRDIRFSAFVGNFFNGFSKKLNGNRKQEALRFFFVKRFPSIAHAMIAYRRIRKSLMPTQILLLKLTASTRTPSTSPFVADLRSVMYGGDDEQRAHGSCNNRLRHRVQYRRQPVTLGNVARASTEEHESDEANTFGGGMNEMNESMTVSLCDSSRHHTTMCWPPQSTTQPNCVYYRTNEAVFMYTTRFAC